MKVLRFVTEFVKPMRHRALHTWLNVPRNSLRMCLARSLALSHTHTKHTHKQHAWHVTSEYVADVLPLNAVLSLHRCTRYMRACAIVINAPSFESQSAAQPFTRFHCSPLKLTVYQLHIF